MPVARRRIPARRAARPWVLLLAGLFAGLLAACERTPPPPTPPATTQAVFFSFGTLVSVELWGTSPELGRQALAAIEGDLNYMHFAWHAWKPGSLGRVNQLLATGAWFTANPSVLPLVKRAHALWRRSGGLFNPAMGELLALWGFQSDAPPQGPPPSAEAIAAWLASAPRPDDLEMDGLRLRSRNPHLRLDLGGIAKGYALAQIADNLRDMGVPAAILNAGGDLYAWGRPGERPWRIGIRHPRRAGIIATLDIRGAEAVFTSGDYERYVEYAGHRYPHILDPRTGYPAEGVQAVTVIHADPTLADAAATALYVAGVRDWPRAAVAMGVREILLIDAEGRLYLTPEMRQRLRFVPDAPRPVVVHLPAS